MSTSGSPLASKCTWARSMSRGWTTRWCSTRRGYGTPHAAAGPTRANRLRDGCRAAAPPPAGTQSRRRQSPQCRGDARRLSRVPLPDDSVDAVISCSAFGVREARGGERGLYELQRVTRPGGRILILWPEDPAWFARHGFWHATLPWPPHRDLPRPGRRLCYRNAILWIRRAPSPGGFSPAELPFRVLGVKPPRDFCCLTVRK